MSGKYSNAQGNNLLLHHNVTLRLVVTCIVMLYQLLRSSTNVLNCLAFGLWFTCSKPFLNNQGTMKLPSNLILWKAYSLLLLLPLARIAPMKSSNVVNVVVCKVSKFLKPANHTFCGYMAIPVFISVDICCLLRSSHVSKSATYIL